MSYNRRTLSPDSPYAIIAALLLFASAAMGTVGYVLSPTRSVGVIDIIVGLALPTVCCLIMGVILLSRKNSLIPTVYPLVGVVVYFIYSTLEDEVWKTVVLSVLCTVFALVYALTVTGTINTRVLLMGLCAAAIVYLIVVETLIISPPDSFESLLPTLSATLVMFGLLVESAGMRRGRLY